jgi:signal transduction histidine kinase
MAGGVSHEFNNLLLAIRGNAALLLMSEVLDPSTRTRLEQIESAAVRATELTRRFQTVTRSAEARPVLIDFKDAAREAVEWARLGSRRKITFALEAGPGPLPVLMDYTLATRTLLALCGNAAESMPDGGKVTVTLDTPPVSAIPSHRTEAAGHTMLRCCIRDTGTGIAAESNPRLFSPFYTTKPGGRGTGLGLAMARETIESHEGWIELDSMPGSGTALTVFLPQACSQRAP